MNVRTDDKGKLNWSPLLQTFIKVGSYNPERKKKEEPLIRRFQWIHVTKLKKQNKTKRLPALFWLYKLLNRVWAFLLHKKSKHLAQSYFSNFFSYLGSG